LRRAIGFGGLWCAGVGLVCVILRQPVLALLGGEPQLVAALVVGLAGYAACFVARGALSGSGHLVRYGLLLAIESAFRLGGCVILALQGSTSVPMYGWLFGVAPWVALASVAVGRRRPRPVSDSLERGEALARPLGWLLAGSLATQVLIGAGPVTAQLLDPGGDQARVGALLAALVLVRVPVLLFTAVQASMLPLMSAHVAAERDRAFVGLVTRTLVIMGGLTIITTVGCAILGPSVLRMFFGSDYVVTWTAFLLMGVSVGIFLAAVVLGQAVLALGSHRHMAIGWMLGVSGLAAGLILGGHDIITRATVGLLVGATIAATVHAAFLAVRMSRWRAANASMSDGPLAVRSATA
jgi:O-antigen/teichoic acid export membrane protein